MVKVSEGMNFVCNYMYNISVAYLNAWEQKVPWGI